MRKKELRKLYLEKRQALSEGEYLQLNYLITEMFFAHINLSFISVLHTFLPIEKNKEPNTWPIVDRIRREFPQVRISIPRVNQNLGELENFYFEGLHQLSENIWGIPEPRQGTPTPSEKIDMVLVPLLVFDETGHRVGYGKGFYDRFLEQCRPNCHRIGLSLFEPVAVIDDVDHYDRKLTQVITPHRAITF
jgi:5-formyltetrahydrofolate cyclo-ligase